MQKDVEGIDQMKDGMLPHQAKKSAKLVRCEILMSHVCHFTINLTLVSIIKFESY